MTDATRRKLNIPNWYPPYLEKHRIYDLFHELARELVIQEPSDHILFLKQVLYHASASKDTPRIILLGPPQVNVYELAKKISDKTKAVVITERDIIGLMSQSIKRPRVKLMVKCLSELLRTENIHTNGWILPDFPKNIKEARAMQQAGILATHVFQLIPPFSPSIYELNLKKVSPNWIGYRRTILGLKDAFKSNLKEIMVADKNLTEATNKCMQLLNIRRRYKAPIIPRICILGPRGSGRKSQAKLLAKRFNLVYEGSVSVPPCLSRHCMEGTTKNISMLFSV